MITTTQALSLRLAAYLLPGRVIRVRMSELMGNGLPISVPIGIGRSVDHVIDLAPATPGPRAQDSFSIFVDVDSPSREVDEQ